MAKPYHFVCLFLVVVFLLLSMPIAEYSALHLGFYDTGIFQTWFHNVGMHGEFSRMFFGHIQLAAFPYMVILKLFPAKFDADILLLLQSTMLIIPILFFYKQYGFFVALSYCLYAPLWLNNHSEFHFDPIVVPLLLCFYFFVIQSRLYLAALFAILLMFVKEPFALQTIGCGLFMIVRGIEHNSPEHSSLRAVNLGLLVIFIGGAYFYFALNYILPYFTVGVPSQFVLESSAYSWLGHSLSQIFFYVMSHPFTILWEILSTPDKLCYLFAIFGSLAFIPLLAPSYLIPALPILLISLFARFPSYYNYHNHYTVSLLMPVFFAFAYGLPKAYQIWNQRVAQQKLFYKMLRFAHVEQQKLLYVLLVVYMLIGHIALSSSPFSWLFWSTRAWPYHWRAYVPMERDEMIKQAILKFIPDKREVVVTVQNNINWYPLAHRETYNPFPYGIKAPITVVDWDQLTWKGFLDFCKTHEKPDATKSAQFADFVLLDMQRPWTIGDKSCRWYYGACQDLSFAKQFLSWVDITKKKYQIIFQKDGFMILQRNV